MDAFFDVLSPAVTKPFTASCPARLTRAGFCFERQTSKDTLSSYVELSFLMTFYLLYTIDYVNTGMTRLYRSKLRLLQWFSWLYF